MLTQTIKSLINQLWDKFWSGGISNPLSAIEQISYLLFMRRLDEQDLKRKADAEWTGEKYTSVFSGKFKTSAGEEVKKDTLRWSHFKQMEGGEMLVHIQNRVFPFIKQLNGNGTSFSRHMQDAVFIIPKPSLLVEAISILDNMYPDPYHPVYCQRKRNAVLPLTRFVVPVAALPMLSVVHPSSCKPDRND